MQHDSVGNAGIVLIASFEFSDAFIGLIQILQHIKSKSEVVL